MESDSKRAIVAVILSGIVLFGWQYFFPTPVPVTPAKTEKIEDKRATANPKIETKVAKEILSEKLDSITVTRGKFSYVINNNLEVVEANSINSEEKYPQIYEEVDKSVFFKINGNLQKLYFSFAKESESSYKIQNSDFGISGTVKLTKQGFLSIKLISSKDFGFRFLTKSKEISLPNSQYNQYFIYTKDMKTYSVEDDDIEDMSVNWFGLDFKYHFMGTLFDQERLTRVELKEDGSLMVDSIRDSNSLNFDYILVRKNYDDLTALGRNLKLTIDFGIWEIIAVPILKGLQFFYEVFPNYGIAIILLTIFIRMLTFPLQYKSFKSMKKMQVIQPELKELREKHKDDPQRMQKETMALFKKAKANPVGGCLPLLLQMPIFFAFYKVLYSAVELVDAPFYWWIHDLSEKDPYYILPVLMAGAMFLNTKLTPTATADPAQQKIMMFMPLIFGFIMKDLPSGLTLYIFISTLVGMLQQLFVYKRVS